jgi:hypothetical protein
MNRKIESEMIDYLVSRKFEQAADARFRYLGGGGGCRGRLSNIA